MNSKASRLHPVAAGLCVLVLMFGFCRTTATPYDPEAIRTELERIVREHQVPSIGYALVTRDTVIVADAVGMADEEQKIPAGPENLYRVGSITKSFVALGILKRVYEGKLDLDAKVAELLPELPLRNPWEETHPLRLRHLLEHSSGLPDFKLHEFLLPEGTPLPELEQTILRRSKEWQCRWQPGTRWAYSNLAYTLLGYILETNTGMLYGDYLRLLILEPAGMVHADFYGTDLRQLARSSDSQGRPLSPRPINDHPAGYLHATPLDMARWMQFLLRPPDWLPDGGLEVISRPTSIAGAGNGLLGYGFGFYGEIADGHVALGHNGGIEGYLSKFAVYPEQGVGYFFTLTRIDGPAYASVNTLLRRSLLEERTVDAPTESGESPDPAVVGWYRAASHRIDAMRLASDLFGSVCIRLDGDALIMQGLTGTPTRLFPLGGGYFRAENLEQPTYFIGEHEGRRVLSNGFAYWERGSFVAVHGLMVLTVMSLLGFLLLPVLVLVIHGVHCLRKHCRFAWAVVWPLMGVLGFAAMMGVMMYMGAKANESVLILVSANPFSIGVFVLSLLQPVLWVVSVRSWRRSRLIHGRLTHRLLAVALANWLIVLVVLACYGFIPQMTWRW
jgi:CubicO group peptidase (beta-lactamase class C family)